MFLSVFSEIHVGGHTLWHLSQNHPLASISQAFDTDPLLEIYQSVDHEIGLLAELIGEDADLVLFSVDSLVNDCLENARSLFLPEFLYRWNYPGKALKFMIDWRHLTAPADKGTNNHHEHSDQLPGDPQRRFSP